MKIEGFMKSQEIQEIVISKDLGVRKLEYAKYSNSQVSTKDKRQKYRRGEDIRKQLERNYTLKSDDTNHDISSVSNLKSEAGNPSINNELPELEELKKEKRIRPDRRKGERRQTNEIVVKYDRQERPVYKLNRPEDLIPVSLTYDESMKNGQYAKARILARAIMDVHPEGKSMLLNAYLAEINVLLKKDEKIYDYSTYLIPQNSLSLASGLIHRAKTDAVEIPRNIQILVYLRYYHFSLNQGPKYKHKALYSAVQLLENDYPNSFEWFKQSFEFASKSPRIENTEDYELSFESNLKIQLFDKAIEIAKFLTSCGNETGYKLLKKALLRKLNVALEQTKSNVCNLPRAEAALADVNKWMCLFKDPTGEEIENQKAIIKACTEIEDLRAVKERVDKASREISQFIERFTQSITIYPKLTKMIQNNFLYIFNLEYFQDFGEKTPDYIIAKRILGTRIKRILEENGIQIVTQTDLHNILIKEEGANDYMVKTVIGTTQNYAHPELLAVYTSIFASGPKV
jgi:hypothetical protein